MGDPFALRRSKPCHPQDRQDFRSLKILPMRIGDPDHYLRSAAAAALGNLAEAGRPYTNDLAAALDDSEADVRIAAAKSHSQTGCVERPENRSIAFKDRDSRGLRRSGEGVLVQMGQAGAAFAGSIAPMLDDPHANVRATAVTILGAMGPAGAEFAPRIGALLADGTVHTPEEARAIISKY